MPVYESWENARIHLSSLPLGGLSQILRRLEYVNRQRIIGLATVLAVLQGCATTDREAIPVVDATSPAMEGGRRPNYPQQRPVQQAPQQAPIDSGVVVVPQAATTPLQISNTPITTGPATWGNSTPPSTSTNFSNPPMPSSSMTPQPLPSVGSPGAKISSALNADEQLDGPVLALLTTAQQQQGSGDLNGAAASLERAQRIAPREPQVLYQLAQTRLNQGDPAQAEQLARRALSYSAGRPALQASLWELIAQSRERQGDAAGAAQARQRAKVNL